MKESKLESKLERAAKVFKDSVSHSTTSWMIQFLGTQCMCTCKETLVLHLHEEMFKLSNKGAGNVPICHDL